MILVSPYTSVELEYISVPPPLCPGLRPNVHAVLSSSLPTAGLRQPQPPYESPASHVHPSTRCVPTKLNARWSWHVWKLTEGRGVRPGWADGAGRGAFTHAKVSAVLRNCSLVQLRRERGRQRPSVSHPGMSLCRCQARLESLTYFISNPV